MRPFTSKCDGVMGTKMFKFADLPLRSPVVSSRKYAAIVLSRSP